jgi:parallel beta-helix repeat protein
MWLRLFCLATVLGTSFSSFGREPGTVAAYNVKQTIPGCPTALGNGSNDDAPAINCALQIAGTAGGGIVFLPQGSYSLGSSLSVPSGVTLLGAGFGSVLEPTGNLSQGVVMLTNVSFVSVRYLRIDATHVTSPTAGIALDSGAHNNTIENVTIEHASIEGVGFYNSAESNDYNIVSNNVIQDNGRGTSCGQLVIWKGQHNKIVNNSISTSGEARTRMSGWGVLLVAGTTSDLVQHNLIQGNSVINTAYGIYLTIQPGCPCNGNVSFNDIVDNTVSDDAWWAVLVTLGADHNRIVGNTVADGNLDGIVIQSQGNVINSNTVRDNSISTPTYGGIRFSGLGAKYNTAIGNFSANTLTSSQQQWGVYEDPFGPDYNTITANSATNNKQFPGIRITGPHTVARLNIE